jgi:hypothetical protein
MQNGYTRASSSSFHQVKFRTHAIGIRNWSLKNAAGYVLLSNIYAVAAGNKHLCEYLEQQDSMEKGVKKL